MVLVDCRTWRNLSEGEILASIELANRELWTRARERNWTVPNPDWRGYAREIIKDMLDLSLSTWLEPSPANPKLEGDMPK